MRASKIMSACWMIWSGVIAAPCEKSKKKGHGMSRGREGRGTGQAAISRIVVCGGYARLDAVGFKDVVGFTLVRSVVLRAMQIVHRPPLRTGGYAWNEGTH